MTLWRRFHEIMEGALLETAASDQSPQEPTSVGALFGQFGRAETLPDTGAAFTMAVVALSAKMAKADGVVVPVEIDVFDRLFAAPESERSNVRRLFDLAAADVAGFELYASQIRTMLRDDSVLLRQVLESLFHIASADRALHPGEITFLAAVGQRFGFSEATFRHIRAQFVADPHNPYDVLGVDPASTDEDIKRRYRKLVRENHPDLVIGLGLPADVVEVANRKLQAITDAYAVVARERGL